MIHFPRPHKDLQYVVQVMSTLQSLLQRKASWFIDKKGLVFLVFLWGTGIPKNSQSVSTITWWNSFKGFLPVFPPACFHLAPISL